MQFNTAMGDHLALAATDAGFLLRAGCRAVGFRPLLSAFIDIVHAIRVSFKARHRFWRRLA